MQITNDDRLFRLLAFLKRDQLTEDNGKAVYTLGYNGPSVGFGRDEVAALDGLIRKRGQEALFLLREKYKDLRPEGE